jgi:hypothetical protein
MKRAPYKLSPAQLPCRRKQRTLKTLPALNESGSPGQASLRDGQYRPVDSFGLMATFDRVPPRRDASRESVRRILPPTRAVIAALGPGLAPAQVPQKISMTT